MTKSVELHDYSVIKIFDKIDDDFELISNYNILTKFWNLLLLILTSREQI
jgi:hypothetical protein